jgi:hypothetical protein
LHVKPERLYAHNQGGIAQAGTHLASYRHNLQRVRRGPIRSSKCKVIYKSTIDAVIAVLNAWLAEAVAKRGAPKQLGIKTNHLTGCTG